MITDDNPFDDMGDDSGAFGAAPPPRPPKSSDAGSYAAPARPPKPSADEFSTPATTTSSTSIDIADYERRLADLEARERAVAERERKVARDQTQADQKMEAANKALAGAPADRPAPNWPPCLPKKIAYFDFKAEIPDILRPRCRMAYYHFLATLILLIYNIVCAIACMVTVSAEAIGDTILACVYLPFLGAMYFIVFRRLYKACKSGSSLSYFLFFIGFTIEIIIAIIALVGPERGGFMGIIWCINAFKDGRESSSVSSTSVGYMCLIDAILWGCSVAFMIYLWIHTRVNFQQAGGIKAMRKQALEKATFGVVKAARDHPDAAKKVGKAAVDVVRDNPDVIKGAASAAYGAAHGDD